MTTPLPTGFGIRLDPSVKQLRPDLWFGGSPPRVLRLTASGQQAWTSLQSGPVSSRSSGVLARRLTDTNLAHPAPPPATDASVTVVVPVRDRARELAACLTALGRAWPVIVVDDGSDDPALLAQVAGRHGAQLVRRAVNGGPAAARNTGLRTTRTDIVAFVDSDCTASPADLAALVGHFADPLVAAVAPRIRPLAAATWAGRYTRARSSLDLGKAPARVAPGTRISYVPSAAVLVRRDAVCGVGGFDEALRVGEDVDLIWRLHDAGWRVRYDPAAEAGHQEPDTWPALLARRFRYGTSAGPLARRHPTALPPLVLHPWPTLTVAGGLAQKPAVAAAGVCGAVLTLARTLHRADVPVRGLTPAIGSAILQTGLALGRYATQFAAPVLLAGAALSSRRDARVAAAALLLGPAVAGWLGHRNALDPARFALGSIADEIAYGAGVWTGAVRARTFVPLRPVVVRRPLRIGS